MAYENRAVIVIITKRVLSKPSVKVPEHGQRTRASQKRPIQTILQHISGSLPTEEHIVTSFLAECVRHPESFLQNGQTIYQRRRSVMHMAISGQKFRTVWCNSSSIVRWSQSADLPDLRQLVPNLHRTRSLYGK